VAALRAEYKPTEWLVDGLLPRPGIGLIAGIPGIGKTWLTLSLSLAVATGRSWLNRFQTHQGRVLLILEEEGRSAVVERLDLLYGGLGLPQKAGDNLPIDLLIQQGVSLVAQDGGLGSELQRHVREVQPALIVLDPFRRVHGLDENNSGAMSHLFNLLHQLTQLFTEQPCSLLLIHHLRKRSEHLEDGLERLRGSTDIAASVDSVLEVSGQFGSLVIKHPKSKRGPSLGKFLVSADITPKMVRLKFLDPDIKAEQDRQKVREWVLQILQEGTLNQSQLVEAGQQYGFGSKRIRNTLTELEGESRLRVRKGPKNSKVFELLFAPSRVGEQTAQNPKKWSASCEAG